MRTLVGFLLIAITTSAQCEPLAIPNNASPDKKFSLIITRTTDEVSGETSPMLTLRDNTKGKNLSSVPIETDETDYRKSIDAHWSPGSLSVAVNSHLGQLYGFAVYSVSGGTLQELTVQPMSEQFIRDYFTPETTKSRGGNQVLKWLNPTTFVVKDTMYSVRITYQIGKDRKITATKVEKAPE